MPTLTEGQAVAVATQVRRGPGRPPAGSEDKHARVLEEAVKLFGTAGYAATSLADIAAAADISKAGLLHHFRSKEELFVEVLRAREEAEDKAAPLPKGDNPWMALTAWIERLRNSLSHRELAAVNVAMSGEVLQMGPAAREWKTQRLEAEVADLADRLERGKRAGFLRQEAPSLELARTIVALTDGLLVQWFCATHGGVEAQASKGTDVLSELKLYVDMIKARWAL
ncbi:Intercellular adhesion protein R [Actinomyces bovis]|uniref:Intercellular adhesion protein R n=1 Tax=Actinomyces bovis TaxID=1658 RepID=A0ABY1VNV6_9ACTO|nr:TetR/AcrR family transcriptional regulator [Actinomyces bovis]SPT53660.1 Intercellular adhesion protein R [Actinomyces bovis]VEG55750.1 Intercellular adhesion protein R [Actinomyces israelii]